MLWNFSSLNTLKVQNEDKNLHTWSGWEMVTFFSSWEFFARSCENQLSFFPAAVEFAWVWSAACNLWECFATDPLPPILSLPSLSRLISSTLCNALVLHWTSIQFETKLELEFDQPASNSHPGSALSGIFSFPRISQSVPVAKIGERPGKKQTRNRVSWVKRVKWFVK